MALEGFPEGMLDRPNSGFRKNGEIHAPPKRAKTAREAPDPLKRMITRFLRSGAPTGR